MQTSTCELEPALQLSTHSIEEILRSPTRPSLVSFPICQFYAAVSDAITSEKVVDVYI